MDEENDSDVKEIDKSLNTSPPDMSEVGSVGTVVVKDVISVASEVIEVPKDKPQRVRRNSTGLIGIPGGKPQVQSRYRGNVRVSSTHDFCKHGKRCDQDEVVKPWKVVKKKSGEGSVESLGLRKKVVGSVSGLQNPVIKPQSSVAVGKKPWGSVNLESSGFKGESAVTRSVDGLRVRSNDKARKNRETESNLSGSAVVRKAASGLRNERNAPSPRISDIGISKANVEKNMKNEEKGKTKVISSADVKEKTVCVVESSVRGDQSEKRPSTGKKTPMRSSRDSTPTKQNPGSINTSLNKKKESVSAEVEASPKSARKIRPKKTGVKVDVAKQLNFKKGKTLELKSEGSSPRWIKFRRRAVQEPKTPTELKKQKLRETELNEAKSESCEDSKGQKVVLRHRKAEGKKKMMTLFNNVIEETVNKLTKVRKNKVKALIGAFETVISLQDTKTTTSQKVQRKAATTSASQVSPLVSPP